MQGDEISESAKAVQEVAKATKAGIEATAKLGGFVSKIIGEPTETVVGILTDKLKFMRWERQMRLTERAKEIIESKNIEGELKTVPPKIALPIIENASLEENDELQDLWACLIASAVDPNFDGTLRTAFIDIIKQLEVNDVHILNFIYKKFLEYIDLFETVVDPLTLSKLEANLDGYVCPVEENDILEELKLNKNLYRESIDNLIRVRCVAFFIDNKEVDIPIKTEKYAYFDEDESDVFRSSKSEKVKFNVTHNYDKVFLTQLGKSFAKACLIPKSENKQASEKEDTTG
jgi:hypothetical protein